MTTEFESEFESEFETYETSLSHDILALNLSIMSKKAFYEIVLSNSYAQTKKNIRVFKYFRHLYNSLKLRNWLWEKVLKPKIEQKYHPNYLIKNLGEDDHLETVLNNWK